MIRLSIIIPLLGDEKRLDDTLVSVLENRPNNCEIIVVHNEPYDDPYQLAGEVRFVEAPPRATAAECLNLGLAAGRAPVVHVLACGVEVSSGWAEAAIRHLGDAEVAAVATVVLSNNDPQKIVSAGLGYRAEGVAWRLGQAVEPAELGKCRAELCGPDALAAFYCHSALEAVGGFSGQATDTLMGIDAALKLRRLGFRCALEPRCCVRADADLADERPSFRHGRDAERLFWSWASTRGWARSLLEHATLTVGECAFGLWRPPYLAQLAGRACGAIQAALAGRRTSPNGTLFAEPTPAIDADADAKPLAAARVHDGRRLSRAA
ncbi:MAG: hypothetical protein K8R46_11070 [Pirellulales bacterium]|nr:hypothetical protein [Pirellulales bacterium]